MSKAAKVQRLRRGDYKSHRFVVGNFALEAGRVVLRCVYMGRAYDVPRPPVFTTDATCFYRWRTRQAATQFRDRWGLDAHVYDLHFMDVLPAAPAPSGKGLQGGS